MRLCTVVLSIVIYTLAGTVVSAQAADTDANTPVGLEDYLRLAALNNAGVKAEFEQWKATLEQIPQAKALPDLEFTYERVIEMSQTKVGVMQVFPWFGEIKAKTDAASSSANAAQKRYEAKKLELFFTVKEAFFEYVYLASAIESTKESLELIKHLEEVARAKYISATAYHPDVIRAQVELAKAEEQLKSIEQMREPVVARLNAALNRKSPGMLPWPRKQQFQANKVDHRQVLEMLKTRNPQLQAMELDVHSARSQIEVARKRSYPNIGVGVGLMDTDSEMSGSSGNNNSLMLMFGANIPLWSSSYRAGKLQAQAELRRASHQKIEAENTLVASAHEVLYELDDSAREMKLYGDILVPKSKQLLGASETAYKAGTIDFLSLIDAQQTLLGFQLQYERAAANNQQRLAELEMLVGAELLPPKAQDKP